jgi:hypothetical protein
MAGTARRGVSGVSPRSFPVRRALYSSQPVSVVLADDLVEEDGDDWAPHSTFTPREDAYRLELYRYAWSRCYDRIRVRVPPVISRRSI